MSGTLPFNPRDFENPAYLLDKSALLKNAAILNSIRHDTGAKVLMALKAFAQHHAFQYLQPYLDGVAASSVHEAQLGFECFKKEVHTYVPAYTHTSLKQLMAFSSHFIFNSWSQYELFRGYLEGIGKEIGIRINPGYSEVEVPLYDPCRSGSRLGIPIKEVRDRGLDGLDGVHFHTLCEQNVDVLIRTLSVIEQELESELSKVKWINFGGGHHITRPDYKVETLKDVISRIQKKYDVQVILEPGEAVALNAGYLVCSVIDIIENDGKIAIIDVSATAHMPDVIEMPYQPAIANGEIGDKGPYTYRIGGMTCLAGDEIGGYSFDQPLRIGDKIVFKDMAIYTMVKNTMFNGVPLPSIILWDSEKGCVEKRKDFGYKDFKERLS